MMFSINQEPFKNAACIGSIWQRHGGRRTGCTQVLPISLGEVEGLVRYIAIQEFLFVARRPTAVVRRLQMGADYGSAREAAARGRAFP